MFDQIIEKTPKRVWMLLIMCVWGGAILWFGLVRFDAFGLDEGAAIALILNWSIVDQVINPVTTYGGPDFRALLFIPLGLYWSGSMVAAKVFTLIVCFGAAMLLFSWTKRNDAQQNEEAALLATGLFLIAPVTLGLADSMGVGPYLIALFGLGWVLDRKYRAADHTISSQYFIQLLLVAITITLHPMGLAYPIALAWHWFKNPKSEKQKKQVWTGLAVATGIILTMQTGWIALAWLENPFTSLSYALFGNNSANPADIGLIPGVIFAVLLIVVLLKRGKQLLNDLFGTTLLLALFIGLFIADFNWALIALAILLYVGTPILINANRMLGSRGGFMGQRGLVMVTLLITATIFMQVDKAYVARLESGLLSASDDLIQKLIPEAANPDKKFLAASQWPARTMLIVRADVLPLPPAAEDGPTQLAMIKGITHLIFDHNNPNYSPLAKNFQVLSEETLTLTRQAGGVIIKVRETADEAPDKSMPISASEGDTPMVSEE